MTNLCDFKLLLGYNYYLKVDYNYLFHIGGVLKFLLLS